MELDKTWKNKAIAYVTDAWGTYPNRDWDMSEGYNCYLTGISEFKKIAAEKIGRIEDRLYDDSDKTTAKELLYEILELIKTLKT